jgi:hypothetical protein
MSSASVLAPTVVMSCFNSKAINAHSLSLKLCLSGMTKDQLKQLEIDLWSAAAVRICVIDRDLPKDRFYLERL